MSLLKKLGKDFSIYGLGNSLQKIIGFLLIPLYTRYLSPSDYGVLSSLSSIVHFVSAFASLGLVAATSRYFFKAETDFEKGRVLYSSLIIQMLSYGVIALCALPFSRQISKLLFETEQYQWIVITATLILFVNPISTQFEITFRYYRQAIKFQLVTIIRAIITPSLIVLFVVVLGKGVLGIQLGQLISVSFITIFAFFYFAKKKYTPKFSKKWSVKMLKYGFPLIWSGIAMWVYSVSDRLFLLHYSDLTSVGLYSIGSTFSQPILIINTAIDMAFVVLLMSTYEEEKDINKPKSKNFLINTWNIYLLFIIPISMFISIFGVDILTIATTKDFIPGALAIPFITFNLLIKQGINFSGNGMTLMENTKPVSIIMIASAILNVALNFYFIPNYGFVGACITTLLSTVFYFFCMYYYSQKYFPVKYGLSRKVVLIIVSFSIAVFFPFAELNYEMYFPVWIKILVLGISFPMPFVLGIINYKSTKEHLTTMYSEFANKNNK